MDTQRALSYLIRGKRLSAAQVEEVHQIQQDIESLDGHTAFLFDKINFLMDTRWVSSTSTRTASCACSRWCRWPAAATLIASIYGMNLSSCRSWDGSWLSLRPVADGAHGGDPVLVLLAQRLAQVIMRIWSLHPQHLDAKGWWRCWRETLLAQKVLRGETTGYRNHPQLARFNKHPVPLQAIAAYLHEVQCEAGRRVTTSMQARSARTAR